MKKDGIVRVVIVGCGDRGMIYGREAHSRKGQFKIVGIAEPDDARRAAAAAAFGDEGAFVELVVVHAVQRMEKEELLESDDI